MEGKINKTGYLIKETTGVLADCPWQTRHPDIDPCPRCHCGCAAFEETGKITDDMHFVQLQCMPGTVKYRITEDQR